MLNYITFFKPLTGTTLKIKFCILEIFVINLFPVSIPTGIKIKCTSFLAQSRFLGSLIKNLPA